MMMMMIAVVVSNQWRAFGKDLVAQTIVVAIVACNLRMPRPIVPIRQRLLGHWRPSWPMFPRAARAEPPYCCPPIPTRPRLVPHTKPRRGPWGPNDPPSCPFYSPPRQTERRDHVPRHGHQDHHQQFQLLLLEWPRVLELVVKIHSANASNDPRNVNAGRWHRPRACVWHHRNHDKRQHPNFEIVLDQRYPKFITSPRDVVRARPIPPLPW